jgi:hypothetical protein
LSEAPIRKKLTHLTLAEVLLRFSANEDGGPYKSLPSRATVLE